MPLNAFFQKLCCITPPAVRDEDRNQVAINRPVQRAVRAAHAPLPAQAIPRAATIAAPAAPAVVVNKRPIHLQRYNPQHSYSPDQLVKLLNKRRFLANHRTSLLEDLAMQLYNGELPKAIRAKVSTALALNLTIEDDLLFQGEPRDACFFANAAVDILMSEYGSNMTDPQRTELAGALETMLKTALPFQTHFTVQGVVRDRAGVQNWVTQLRQNHVENVVKNAEFKPIAAQLNEALGRRDEQTVHNKAVIQNGNIMYMQLCNLVPVAKRIPFGLACDQIKAECATPANREDIDLALVRIGRDLCANTETRLLTDLPSVLSVLWTYIQQHANPDIQRSLRNALVTRLVEIRTETPCNTGCLERLLDVPSGIDHELNVFNNPQAIREDVERIAARVNAQFHTLFPGTELADENFVDILDPDLVASLKAAVFSQDAQLELSTILGLNPAEVKQQVNRAAVGFA